MPARALPRHPALQRSLAQYLRQVRSVQCLPVLSAFILERKHPVRLRARAAETLGQIGDLVAETLGDVVAGGRGVLDHIVQQGRDDGRGVELVVRQDARDLDRVGDFEEGGFQQNAEGQ